MGLFMLQKTVKLIGLQCAHTHKPLTTVNDTYSQEAGLFFLLEETCLILQTKEKSARFLAVFPVCECNIKQCT